MTAQLRLSSARTATGGIVDIFIDTSSGIITSVEPSGMTARGNENVMDLNGYIISIGLVEPHAHLDKAFLADRVHNPEGDLMGAIVGLEAIRSSITFEDIVHRSTRAAVALSRNGVTAVRSHADVTLTGGLTPLLALLETQRRCASFIDIQVAMLLEWPLTGTGAAPRHGLARDAIAAGAQVIGGCPHLDDDPTAAVDYLLHLAEECALPLDLHADENLRPSSCDLATLAQRALAEKPSIAMNASHCVSLSVQTEKDARTIADTVAEAQISVTVLPQTNLFLQARDSATNMVRAIAPSTLLRQAGVVVAAGADNMQDPFNPVGRLDPLETAALMVMAGHQSTSHAFDMVTIQASCVMYENARSLHSGMPADLVAIPAHNIRQAIANGPSDRLVFKKGRLITTDDYANAAN